MLALSVLVPAGAPRLASRGAEMNTHQNLAARMARWSARHRKRAFWGWIAFVIVAFAMGNMVGSTPISDVDQWSGESHDAEAALDRAGLRPTSEVVFLQSDKLTVEDPEFRAAVADVRGACLRFPTSRTSSRRWTEAARFPRTAMPRSSISRSRAIRSRRRMRVDAVLAAVARMQSDHPEREHRAVRRRECQQGHQRDDRR